VIRVRTGAGEERANTKKRKRIVLFWLITVAAILLVIQFVARLAVVRGDSMADTLSDGNIVLVWQLGYVPRPGDIVVTDRNNPLAVRMIKRVVAIGGQTVKTNGDAVTVDGEKLTAGTEDEGEWAEYFVPPDHVFLLGDNISFSKDSREIGPVRTDNVMGRVTVRVFPPVALLAN
jgi:signal peptidase I